MNANRFARAVHTIVDLLANTQDPKKWKRWPRRIYVCTLPVSVPLLLVWRLINIAVALFAIALCLAADALAWLCRYGATVWKGSEQ